jgi:hypothetical protein
MDTTLLERAGEVARSTVAQRWDEDRFELALAREGDERWSHIFERAYYEASFQLRENAGTATVTNGPAGWRVLYPSPGSEEPGEPAVATEAELARALGIAEEAARRSGREGALWLRPGVVRRLGGGRGLEVPVRVFTAATDGPVHVELDATTGERIGFFVPAFLRGSRSGRPLSEREVAARVAAEQPPPEGARLVKAHLEEGTTTRSWRLRFDVETAEASGHFLVCAHARTGAVAGITSTVRARTVLGDRQAREHAEAVVASALPGLLGEDARLGTLIPGALVRRGKPRSGWVGTVTTSEGDVARVSFSGEEVEVALGGRALRTRVTFPAP